MIVLGPVGLREGIYDTVCLEGRKERHTLLMPGFIGQDVLIKIKKLTSPNLYPELFNFWKMRCIA